MFNNELRNSMKSNLDEVFDEIYSDFMKRKGDSAQNPAEISKEFPIEIVSDEDIFEVLHEAIQKKAYGHFGYFSKYGPSTVARDRRLSRRKVFSNFKEIVCFRGEVYEFTSSGGNSSNTFEVIATAREKMNKKLYNILRYIPVIGRIIQTKTNTKFEWRERKVLQDISGNWHLWDGTYGIAVWEDDSKRVILTKPKPPTKIYPHIES